MLKLIHSNIKKLFFAIISIITVCTFMGCAKYKPNSFSKPTEQNIEKNNLTVSAKLLVESGCKNYFSRRFLKKGFQPVQLYIQNNSNKEFTLDTSSINLPIESRDYVASRVHIDPVPRVVGWAVGGLVIWPFLIPAAVEAIQCSKANRKLDDDFESRTLDMNSKVIIKSHATINKVFFVRKENMSEILQFKLKEQKTKTITAFELDI